MKTIIDEFDMSFPINIWGEMLYENVQEFGLDIYYNAEGFPKNILDLLGEEFIDEYRISLINEICKKNNTNDIWRVTSDGFAIITKTSNCSCFEMKFKGLVFKILKRTIVIKEVNAKVPDTISQ